MKQTLLIFTFLTLCAHYCFANDVEESPPKKLTRKELIAKSAQQCKVPCWTQACQAYYPRCPLTTCNHDYDATMDKLFYSEGPWNSSRDHKKKYCVDAIRGGYGCFNIYKFVCPVMNMTVGKNIKMLCAKQFIQADIFHPRIQSYALAAPFCITQFCCSLLIKKCDYYILDSLSNPDTYGPKPPEIEDV